MPRSGFVLYTNALWHFVKRLYVAAARRRDSPQREPALPPVLGRRGRVPPRPPARALRPRPRAQPRPLPELRQLRGLRGRGRRARQRARGAMRHRRRRRSPSHPAGARARAGQRALSGAHGLRPDHAREPALAAVHVAPPPESRVAVPQRRRLAVRRRVLGCRARARRHGRPGAPRSRAARAGERAARLAVQRVAARPHARAERHAGTVVERGRVPDRRATRSGRTACSRAGSAGPGGRG